MSLETNCCNIITCSVSAISISIISSCAEITSTIF